MTSVLRRKITRQEQVQYLPRWLRERLELQVMPIVHLMERAARQIPAGARVLDAGSGDGRFTPYFRHTRYVGVDLAIGDPAWDYSSVDVLANLIRLPFADATFDAAICTQTLEHVTEPKAVLQEIGRCLRPGGRLYLSVPQSQPQHQKPNDYFRYTSFGLRYLLGESGMVVERLEPIGGYFSFLAYQLQVFSYWLFQAPETPLRRALTLPVKAVLWVLLFLTAPLLLIPLDRVDRLKDVTIGWVCQAVRVS